MARFPFEIDQMLSAPGIRPQMMQAVNELAKVLAEEGDEASRNAKGRAYKICNIWQHRFELALRSEIPDWVGLAAFRCITDFNVPPDRLKAIFPSYPADGIDPEDCSNTIDNSEKIWRAYKQYLEQKKDLHAGKLRLKGDAESHFLKHLDEYEPVLGGQAGNILWLWLCIGARAIAYTPYFSEELAKLSDKLPILADLKLLRFKSKKSRLERLEEIKDQAGVPKDDGSRVGAPSGGSVIVVKGGRRLIYQFTGVRDLHMKPTDSMPWDNVQFLFEGKELLEEPIKRTDPQNITWPGISLFCECYVDDGSKTLFIRLTEDEEVKEAFGGKVDFAILGGIDGIFRDDWIKQNPILQARLLAVVERQLKALAACGIRIGVELSGFPGREYAHLIQRLCREEVIVALGINGVDELPDVVGQKSVKDNQLYEFWLDPQTVASDLQAEVSDSQTRGEHFEYITYLRAKKLAEATGVRTLYVHTMTLDFILRKDADPGALLRAQLGDMMGKGLVIAALLQRAYGKDKWLDELKQKMPPAVKPEAMAKLGSFAKDFERYEGLKGTEDRILNSGYWLAPVPNQYSVAVVPVMWPHVSEDSQGEELPEKLNPTGSGDMTFGAFFFLGGV